MPRRCLLTALLLAGLIFAVLTCAARADAGEAAPTSKGALQLLDDAADVPAELPGEAEFREATTLLYDAAATTPATAQSRKDLERAVQLLHAAADVGFAAAQSRLGTLYAFGLGVERSEARAVLFYTFAAMNGDVEANVVLAHRRQHGVGMPKSCKEAVKFAKFAADSVAMGYSAEVQPKYDSTKLDDVESGGASAVRPSSQILAVHELKCDGGTSDACMFLGMAYMYGLLGVRANGQAAVEYFTKALRLGNNAAYGALGQLYSQGMPSTNPPIARDLDKARRLYTKGAEANHNTALNGLGFLHAIGAMDPNGEKNFKEAYDLFKRSADQGNAEGMYNLGVLYLNGRGAPRDVDKARNLFTGARLAGSVLARYQLGNMDLFGLGELAQGCTGALAHFNDVNERGRWRRRQETARERYDRGEYGAALVDYLILAEQGVPYALHNAVFLLTQNHGNGMGFIDAPIAAAATAGSPSAAADDEESLEVAHREDGSPAESSSSASTSMSGSAAIARDEPPPLDPRDVVMHALLWRAVQQGERKSHLQLGDNYYYGRGTRRSLQLAEEHYMQAALAGSAEGHFNVALMYEEGSTFTPKDYHLAKRHYDAAAESSPHAYAAVWLALQRLNLRWWWEHFGGSQQQQQATPAADNALASSPTGASGGVGDTSIDADDKGAERRTRSGPAAAAAAADDADTWAIDDGTDAEKAEDGRSWAVRVGEAVDGFMPAVFGVDLDTIVLFGAVAIGLLLLQLRHQAA